MRAAGSGRPHRTAGTWCPSVVAADRRRSRLRPDTVPRGLGRPARRGTGQPPACRRTCPGLAQPRVAVGRTHEDLAVSLDEADAERVADLLPAEGAAPRVIVRRSSAARRTGWR